VPVFQIGIDLRDLLSAPPVAWAIEAALIWLLVSVCAGAHGPSDINWATGEAQRTPSRTTFPMPTIGSMESRGSPRRDWSPLVPPTPLWLLILRPPDRGQRLPQFCQRSGRDAPFRLPPFAPAYNPPCRRGCATIAMMAALPEAQTATSGNSLRCLLSRCERHQKNRSHQNRSKNNRKIVAQRMRRASSLASNKRH
jgi:hypothetical protein